MFDMTSHFQSKSMQVLHHLLIVMMYLYSSWSVAQGINLWGEHESTDMDSTWGQGPQMTFSNPAGLIQHQGLGLSYDLKLYMNDFMTDPHKVIQVHQGALSAGIGKYYQTSLGFQGGSATDFLGNTIYAYGLTSAHAVKLNSLRIGFSAQFLTRPEWAQYSLHTIPHQNPTLINSREITTQYKLGVQWQLNPWLAMSSIWRHVNDYQTELGDYSVGIAVRPHQRWITSVNFRPAKGSHATSTHTRIRLWKGLAVELSYDYQNSLYVPIQQEYTPIHYFSASLAWLGQIGWRASFLHKSSGDQSSHGYGLSLRFNQNSPQAYQLFQIPKTVVLPIGNFKEVQAQFSILQRSKYHYPFLQTLLSLRDLSQQQDVQAILLIMNPEPLGWAQAEELAQSIQRVRQKGKKVYLFSAGFTHTHYLLASYVDSIWTSPTGAVEVSGFLNESLYFKNLLDYLNIKAEFLAVGEYKSAPETFTHTQPSEASQKVKNDLLNQKYGFFTQHLRARVEQYSWKKRGKSYRSHYNSKLYQMTKLHLPGELKKEELWQQSKTFKKVKTWIDQGPYTAQDAKQAGLVDVVVPIVHLENEIKKQQYGYYTRLTHYQPKLKDQWVVHQSIAVIHCVGEIGGGLLPIKQGPTVSAVAMIPLLKQALKQESIKGVVIRIDSPGGAVSDADEIWQAVRDLARYKPVAVSMGNIAASGGYYIASAAHKIFAQPMTLTGSIGVFAGKVDLSQTLERLGVSIHRDRRGEGGGALSMLTPWQPKQKERLYQSMQKIYDLFLKRIMTGRKKLKLAQLQKLAGGRVWSGLQAYQYGLVDDIGGLLDAIDWVAKQRQLKAHEYTLLLLSPTASSLLDKISKFGSISSYIQSSLTATQKLWQSLITTPQWKAVETIPHMPKDWMKLLRMIIHYPSQAILYDPRINF